MRHLLLLIITLFMIGCGGASVDDTSGSSIQKDTSDTTVSDGTQNISSSSYDLWSYIVPNTQNETLAISSNTIDGYSSYQATFRSIDSDNIVEEIPQNTTDERVVYEKNDNNIDVIFYKNDKIIYSYKIKRVAKIKDQTIDNSSCFLVNHFDTYNVEETGKTYTDVVEIACGLHSGFYARGKGQIDQK